MDIKKNKRNNKKQEKTERKNNKGFNLPWTIGIVVVSCIVSALATGVITYNNTKITESVTYADLLADDSLNEFLAVYAQIISEYYEDVDKSELLEKAIAGMMSYLGDDYSSYLNDTATSELLTELAGEYEGIGVAINNTDKTITKVYDNTPASEAGIVEGDIIIAVNSTSVEEATGTEVVSMIQAIDGKFSLTFKRGGETVEVTLEARTIAYPNVDYMIIESSGSNVGYISISAFSLTLESQMTTALNNLENSGIDSLIIDVRQNSGGYLKAATDVISKFLKKGAVIYSLDNNEEVTSYYDETSESRDYPIAVLIDEGSASASEVLAAALKESYGATLVGTTSYGKGKVQQTMELSSGSMVKYTSAYWLTPSGTCIDEVGITPDYVVTLDDSVEGDEQLNKALEVLTNQ